MIRALTIASLLFAFLQIPNCRQGVSHDKWEGIIVEDHPDTRLIILTRMEFPAGSKFSKRMFLWQGIRVPPYWTMENTKEDITNSDNKLLTEWLNLPDELVAIDEDKVVNAKGVTIAEFQGREVLMPKLEFYGDTYLRHDMSKKIMVMRPVEKFSTISEIYYGKEQKATKPNEADAQVGATGTPGFVQGQQQAIQNIQQGVAALSGSSGQGQSGGQSGGYAAPNPRLFSGGTPPAEPASNPNAQTMPPPSRPNQPNTPNPPARPEGASETAASGGGAGQTAPGGSAQPPKRVGDRGGNTYIYIPVDWDVQEGDEVLIINAPPQPSGEPARIEIESQLMDMPMEASLAAQTLLLKIQESLPNAMATQPKPFQLKTNVGSRFEFTLADDPTSRRFQVYSFTNGNLLYIVRVSTNAKTSPADRRAIDKALNSLEMP